MISNISNDDNDLTALFVETAKQAAITAAHAQIALIEHLINRVTENRITAEDALKASESVRGKWEFGKITFEKEVQLRQLRRSLKVAQKTLEEVSK